MDWQGGWLIQWAHLGRVGSGAFADGALRAVLVEFAEGNLTMA